MVRLRFNQETKDWDELEKDVPKSDMDITIDRQLVDYCIHVRKKLNKDNDEVMIIVGDPGSGKSNNGRLLCRIVSNENFHPRTHIINTVEDIKRVFLIAKKGECILFDESSGIFGATDTMTKKTKYANYVLDVCRQKNLFLVIVAPFLSRLSSAVAVDRSDVLLRAYINKNTGSRGSFAFYGTKKKEIQYRFAKKNHGSIRGCLPKFYGTIGRDKTFTEEYKNVKDETLLKALDSFDNGKSEPKPQEIIIDHNLTIVKNNMERNREDMAKLLNISTRTVDRLRAKAKEAPPIEISNS